MFRSAASPFSCSLVMVPRRDSSMSGALRSAASAMTAFTSSVVVMVSKFVWWVASRSKSPRFARLTALARSSMLTSGMAGDGNVAALGMTGAAGTSTGAPVTAGGVAIVAAGVGAAAAAGAAAGCTGPAGVGFGIWAGAGPAMTDAGAAPGTAVAGGAAAPAMAVGSASAAGRVTFASRAARRTSLVRPKSGMGHFP